MRNSTDTLYWMGAWLPAAFGPFALLAALMAPSAATAQSLPSTDLERVLRDLPRAGMVCPRDEAVGTPAAPEVRRAAGAVDQSCAVEVPIVASWLQRAETMLVDLRPASDNAIYRVVGSVNLSPSEVAGRSYLKSKPLVLLGSGKDDAALLGRCAALKGEGFAKVHVVRGGMMGWIGADLPVEGRRPSLSDLGRLSAEEVWATAQVPEVLTLVEGGAQALLERLPPARRIPDLSIPSVVRAVDARAKDGTALPVLAVLLVGAKPWSGADIDAMRRRLSPVPVLVNAIGKDEMLKRWGQMEAVWAAHAKGPKRPACRG